MISIPTIASIFNPYNFISKDEKLLNELRVIAMKYLINIVKNPLESTLCIILVLMVSISFFQVISRYLLHVSLSWSEESCRFLLMWMGMLSAAYGFKIKSHFSLNFVKNKFTQSMQKNILVFITILMSIFLIIFIYYAIELTVSATNRIGPGTKLSYSIPYSSSIVGGILMLYYLIKSFYIDYFSKTKK